MLRARAIDVVLVLCLATSAAIAGEPPEMNKAGEAHTQRAPVQPPEIQLPPRIQTACTKAKGDLAFVCGEYERLFRQMELEKIAAGKRLQALTRGGVIEVLQ